LYFVCNLLDHIAFPTRLLWVGQDAVFAVDENYEVLVSRTKSLGKVAKMKSLEKIIGV